MAGFLYPALLCLRLVIVLTSTSFIHPDEHFQNIQIAVQDTFSRTNVSRSWEWDPARLPDSTIAGGPVRSIVPVWVTSHLGLSILKTIHRLGIISRISTRSLVIAPRLVLFLLSVLGDKLVFRHTRSLSLRLLLASSPHTLLYVSRTFSNSLESIVFTVVLLLSLSIAAGPVAPGAVALWTFLNVFGVWVRVSYIGFALPLVLYISWTRILRSASLFVTAALTAICAVLGLIALDSAYFDRWPTITPLGLFVYNLYPHNLAVHGTHPRWLHLLVNGPIAFGPALWLDGLRAICTRPRPGLAYPIAVKLSAASIVSATSLLSLQPHQEPRFLLPLALPLAVMGSLALSRMHGTRVKRWFWACHLTHSAIIVVLFGYVHQGGLQAALQALPAKVDVLVSWKTFDVPSMLIAPPDPVAVRDLRGAPEAELVRILCEQQSLDVWLLAPRWAVGSHLERGLQMQWQSSMVHVDLERLDLMWQAGWSRSGVGLWEVDHNLMKSIGIC